LPGFDTLVGFGLIDLDDLNGVILEATAKAVTLLVVEIKEMVVSFIVVIIVVITTVAAASLVVVVASPAEEVNSAAAPMSIQAIQALLM
jgi:hypothetical protein